ncbi:MAG: glutamine-synthetase adenylyltransferase, partial [Pseudomonadota bacterium]
MIERRDLVARGLSATLLAAAERAWDQAPFLRGLMRRHPDWLDDIASLGVETFLSAAIDRHDRGDDVQASLRDARARVALGTALGDLAGDLPLDRVVATLSAFADRAIDTAVRAAIAERVPDAPSDGITAIALGKLGSRELNYSSDVDLVFIYDGDRIICREGEDPEDAARRIVRRTAELLQRSTKDGYVLRVDLRLKPDAETAAVAIPRPRAELYYHAEALTWERAAYIRARPVAGDLQMGADFLAEIAPFVWRRSVDYTAIRDIEDMSLDIRDQYEDGQTLGPGYDLKRGRGGIREIEFFAQGQQLIHGGRDASLRVPDTRGALAALAAAGHIDAGVATDLSATYELLRTAEHRLQMREDAQTHMIPKRAGDRKAFAVLMGAADYRAVERRLAGPVARVEAAYDGLTQG